MDTLRPPQPLQLTGNIKKNWELWEEEYNIYMIASGADKKDKKVIVNLTLHILGRDARQKLKSLALTDAEKQDAAVIVQKMSDYCVPKTNSTIQRHVLRHRFQHEGEPFINFLTDIKNIAKTCDFSTSEDSFVKDQILEGVHDPVLKAALWVEKDITLDRAVELATIHEARNKHLKFLGKQPAAEPEGAVGGVTYKKNQKGNRKGFDAGYQGKKSQAFHNNRKGFDTGYQGKKSQAVNNTSSSSQACKRCNGVHQPKQCPAYINKVICDKCKKQGHYARCCKINKSNVGMVMQSDNGSNDLVLSENPQLSVINEGYNLPMYSMDRLHLGCISSDSNCNIGTNNLSRDKQQALSNQKFCTLKVNGQLIPFRIDTGADVNAIPFHYFNSLVNKPKLYSVTEKLRNFDGSVMDIVGKCHLNCYDEMTGIKGDFLFYVIKTAPDIFPALSIILSQMFKKVKFIANVSKPEKCGDASTSLLIQQNQDLFDGIGEIKGYECSFKLKPGFVGRIEPCRKIPYKLYEAVQDELKFMLTSNIIAKVEEPTDMVNPIVIVKKQNNQIRICLDPTYLNQYLMREQYALPTFEDLTAKMHGAKYFSKLDANKGFYMIKLDKKSSFLTTFNTPFGRFRYLRLPFGLSISSEIFDRVFSQIFENVPNLAIFRDDMKIYAPSIQEHNKCLSLIFDKARQAGVQFNGDKCEFLKPETKFMGHIFSSLGLKPDPAKVNAIKQYPQPNDIKSMQRFLGLVTYVGKFIPNLADKTAPLRELIKESNQWHWDKPQENAFQSIKAAIAEQQLLKFYDVNKDVVISVDASKDGVGAVLMQEGFPLLFASRALTETQQRWAQIEKELFAIVFGCERFYQYIFAKQVLVLSDHKPLEPIFQKKLDDVPLRLQRMRIRLQKFDIKVQYTPGKQLVLADALSRAYITEEDDPYGDLALEDEIEYHVSMILDNIGISDDKLAEIAKETKKDAILMQVAKYIQNGWPNGRSRVPEDVKFYYKYREELTLYKDIVCLNKKLVIPSSLRQEMLGKIHFHHLGIEKCKTRASEVMYWPNMSQQIENLILNCAVCLDFRNAQASEPMMKMPIPTLPWEVLGMDVFSIDGIKYIVVVDKYSKYPEVMTLEDMSAASTVHCLKQIFSRHGTPKTVYADNGKNFDCQEYNDFAKAWNFKLITSSPTYAQSNGFIERHGQTFKRLFLKARRAGQDFAQCLLEYRNTPIDRNLPSPAELLFSRKIRGQMPLLESHFEPKVIPCIADRLKQKQELAKSYYDRRVKPLPGLSENDTVRAWHRQKWQEGIITGKADRPRSYKILLNSTGNVISRNRKHIIKFEKANSNRVEDLPFVPPTAVIGATIINELPNRDNDSAEDSDPNDNYFDVNEEVNDQSGDIDVNEEVNERSNSGDVRDQASDNGHEQSNLVKAFSPGLVITRTSGRTSNFPRYYARNFYTWK